MRVLLQRVSCASVTVEGRVTGAIDRGLLLLVGIGQEDTWETLESMARKILHLRLFPDTDSDSGFHFSVLDIQGGILAVSQFTLHASCRKGRRPSFTAAAPPDEAERLFDAFVETLRREGAGRVETGEFGAMMDVSLVNDGPVTIWLDSAELAASRSQAGS